VDHSATFPSFQEYLEWKQQLYRRDNLPLYYDLSHISEEDAQKIKDRIAQHTIPIQHNPIRKAKTMATTTTTTKKTTRKPGAIKAELLALQIMTLNKPVTPAEINRHVGKGEYASKYMSALKKLGCEILSTKDGRKVATYTLTKEPDNIAELRATKTGPVEGPGPKTASKKTAAKPQSVGGLLSAEAFAEKHNAELAKPSFPGGPGDNFIDEGFVLVDGDSRDLESIVAQGLDLSAVED